MASADSVLPPSPVAACLAESCSVLDVRSESEDKRGQIQQRSIGPIVLNGYKNNDTIAEKMTEIEIPERHVSLPPFNDLRVSNSPPPRKFRSKSIPSQPEHESQTPSQS
jgi:hypothetical protein